jgi:hypothetical protein
MFQNLFLFSNTNLIHFTSKQNFPPKKKYGKEKKKMGKGDFLCCETEFEIHKLSNDLVFIFPHFRFTNFF